MRIAALWSALLGVPITARQAIHMMILLKVSRDQAGAYRDNEVDICGYAHLLQMDREDYEETPHDGEFIAPTDFDEMVSLIRKALLGDLMGEAPITTVGSIRSYHEMLFDRVVDFLRRGRAGQP